MILYTQKCVCNIPLDMKAEDIGSKQHWLTNRRTKFLCLLIILPFKIPSLLSKKVWGDAETIYKAFVLWSQMPGAFEDGKAAMIGELVREMM